VSTVETGGPTVVLVHGAFAGTDSWAGVVERLLNAGVPVKAVVNPRRALATDAAYVAGIVSQVPGPVVLVGHSYGGMVVTNAASQTTNVVGLVYVGALVPVEGETAADIIGRSTDSLLNSAVLPNEYPAGSDTATEFIIDPARFRQMFAADLPQLQSDILAYSQRPVAGAALGEKSGPPAWKNLPSWAAVGTADKAAGSDVVRSVAERAGATITEIDASHAVMVTQPDAVTEVILTARKNVS
jgi:pimeloyl-ACP methyl ester carboxylesterase